LRLGAYRRAPVGREDHDGDGAARDALLEGEILVSGNKDFERAFFGFVEQLPVCEGAQPISAAVRTSWPVRMRRTAARNVFVEQNPHPFDGIAPFAKRSTPLTRSSGSSKISVAISSAVDPSRALSTIASAGTRESSTTQAPERRPDTLSTSSHFDQSIGFSGMMSVLPQLRRDRVGRTLRPYPAMSGVLSAHPATARTTTESAGARSASLWALAPINAPRIRVKAGFARG
jgi:hypothetical protein